MSVPISETMISAACAATPGIVSSKLHRFFKRAAVLLDFLIKARNGFIQAVDLAQQFGQNKAMMRL